MRRPASSVVVAVVIVAVALAVGLGAVVAVAVGLGAVAAACDAPAPLKSASGERIAGLELREDFAMSDEPREVAFHGDTLRRAVEAMDKHGVFALSGTYEPGTGVLHRSTLVLVVKTTGDRERRVVVKDCAEPHVCAFLADLEAAGRFETKPLVCRSQAACSR